MPHAPGNINTALALGRRVDSFYKIMCCSGDSPDACRRKPELAARSIVRRHAHRRYLVLELAFEDAEIRRLAGTPTASHRTYAASLEAGILLASGKCLST